jgi:hypothetical protein
MIATRTEIKTLLQIVSNVNDALIDALIPIVQGEIIDYCNTHFARTILNSSNEEYEGSNTISFTALTKTITDTSSNLPFAAGQDVYIAGSRYNDGHVSLVTAGTGSMVTSEVLYDEVAGADVTIKLVVWPKALKMIVADMIAYKISGKENGVVSESISGAISTNYAKEYGSYPETIYTALNKYRVVGVY